MRGAPVLSDRSQACNRAPACCATVHKRAKARQEWRAMAVGRSKTEDDGMETRGLIFGRVLFALIMREMATRYGRSAGGYLWALLDPLGFIILMSFIFSQITRNPPIGDSFPLFYATGYMAFHFYVDISGIVSGSIQLNRPLLAFPRVNLLDTILARFILQFLTISFVSTVILTGFILYDGAQIRMDAGPILLSVCLASFLGLGVASINVTLFIYFETYQKIFSLINRPLFLISGIFFTFESMPVSVQEFLWWNPLVHVTALMRSGFYPIYEPSFVSPVYVLIFATIPLIIGILLLRLLRSDIIEK
jgi:capsular polysaccharide transport system permease protein